MMHVVSKVFPSYPCLLQLLDVGSLRQRNKLNKLAENWRVLPQDPIKRQITFFRDLVWLFRRETPLWFEALTWYHRISRDCINVITDVFDRVLPYMIMIFLYLLFLVIYAHVPFSSPQTTIATMGMKKNLSIATNVYLTLYCSRN